MKKILVVLLLFVFTACEDVFIEKDPPSGNVTNFDLLWKELDRKYSFFEYKRINWDSVYTVYRPQIHNNLSREELFEVMAQMLSTLRDGHVNLRSGDNISKYENWFLDYPANVDRELLIRHYWGDYHITGPLINTIIGEVGYIHYSSFRNPISADNLDYIFTRFKDTEGLIIDIRSNEGGNPKNSFKILERIISERKMLYKQAFKNGPGHQDFEPFHEVYLTPDLENVRFEKKVVVLTNRRCYSAANYFAASCKALGITLIGDQTGGGGGVPAGSELPNGFHVNYSASVSLLPDGYNMEAGIVPDIAVNMAEADRTKGIDSIIERALLEFK
ncbi:S41 family peptidase [Rhodocytophaga aerolata]|uniref:S41 family peptidase n=1 Tax=Rhodocytophaga aerolata TaxID=455078 RepID=A0ABT8RBK9_9BACT|nr:S41 family peptidase [Rhodocytophaga aerolata]MDO1449491.1 S41 family peptidase [Rhodocytophaga aerolata]